MKRHTVHCLVNVGVTGLLIAGGCRVLISLMSGMSITIKVSVIAAWAIAVLFVGHRLVPKLTGSVIERLGLGN